ACEPMQPMQRRGFGVCYMNCLSTAVISADKSRSAHMLRTLPAWRLDWLSSLTVRSTVQPMASRAMKRARAGSNHAAIASSDSGIATSSTILMVYSKPSMLRYTALPTVSRPCSGIHVDHDRRPDHPTPACCAHMRRCRAAYLPLEGEVGRRPAWATGWG